jgi:hypothetical protein
MLPRSKNERSYTSTPPIRLHGVVLIIKSTTLPFRRKARRTSFRISSFRVEIVIVGTPFLPLKHEVVITITARNSACFKGLSCLLLSGHQGLFPWGKRDEDKNTRTFITTPICINGVVLRPSDNLRSPSPSAVSNSSEVHFFISSLHGHAKSHIPPASFCVYVGVCLNGDAVLTWDTGICYKDFMLSVFIGWVISNLRPALREGNNSGPFQALAHRVPVRAERISQSVLTGCGLKNIPVSTDWLQTWEYPCHYWLATDLRISLSVLTGCGLDENIPVSFGWLRTSGYRSQYWSATDLTRISQSVLTGCGLEENIPISIDWLRIWEYPCQYWLVADLTRISQSYWLAADLTRKSQSALAGCGLDRRSNLGRDKGLPLRHHQKPIQSPIQWTQGSKWRNVKLSIYLHVARSFRITSARHPLYTPLIMMLRHTESWIS